MSSQQAALPLLGTRRFGPFFVVQFLGAFNDNLFKSALVMLITFHSSAILGVNPGVLVAAAGGIFTLPFFLFSAFAGQLADRVAKPRMIRWVKALEVVLMGAGAIGFVSDNIPLLMVVLFFMGLQSALFGPLKFGYMPEALPPTRLMPANALVEAGTFLAILLGTIVGGLLVMQRPFGVQFMASSVFVVAIIGWVFSLAMPPLKPADPKLRVPANFIKSIYTLSKPMLLQHNLRSAIFGIAWFWFLGSALLALFPPMARNLMGGDEVLVTLFLTAFSIGIGAGSMLGNRLGHGEVNLRWVLGSAYGLVLLFLLCAVLVAQPGIAMENGSVLAYLQQPLGFAFTGALLVLAILGGIYIVPLYVLVQINAPQGSKARAIAVCNIMDALMMVVSAGVMMGLQAAHLHPASILAILGGMHLLFTLWLGHSFDQLKI